MASRSLLLRAAVGTLTAFAVLPPSSRAFTGTHAATAVVREMRSAYARTPAVHTVLSGDVVYCLAVPAEWTFAPVQGCAQAATVTENDNLRRGRIAVGAGTVVVNSRAKVRYVISPAGFYAHAAGTACWRLRISQLLSPRFVSYPFPRERLTVLAHKKHEIVLQATAAGYRELDYVDPRTFLERRQVDETITRQKTYEAVYTIRNLAAPVSPPSTTPACP